MSRENDHDPSRVTAAEWALLAMALAAMVACGLWLVHWVEGGVS